MCTALSTFKSGGFSSRSLLAQSQASDQWSYYQAKSIKSYLYDLQPEKLGLEMKTLDPKTLIAPQELQKKMEAYQQKVKKYEDEKAAIEKKPGNWRPCAIQPRAAARYSAWRSSTCRSSSSIPPSPPS